VPRIWRELPEPEGELMEPFAFSFTPRRDTSKQPSGDETTRAPSSKDTSGDTAKDLPEGQEEGGEASQVMAPHGERSYQWQTLLANGYWLVEGVGSGKWR
jgi:hypothetical protein